MKVFMLVDDSPVIRKVANRILSDLGFVVVEANDGADALIKARTSPPDAMIVDWEMPNLSGLDFLDEYRTVPGSENTKILYCTSEIMVPEMTRAKRAGAAGFLMKPFNRQIMINKLDEAGIEFVQNAA